LSWGTYGRTAPLLSETECLYWGNRCFRFGGANKAERSDALGAAVEVKPVPKTIGADKFNLEQSQANDQQTATVDRRIRLIYTNAGEQIRRQGA